MPKTRILLLTNRDSDNVGDQIIEGSVISLLRAAMKNLGIGGDGLVIESRPASIVPKQYLRTGDPAHIARARKAIARADAVVFGGAPLFNYAYQNFYLRTIKTLELAQEYGVPVLFSSIGVEPFDGRNPKSLALKEALALPCVRQITTRDDLASLQKYAEGTGIPIAHVADPAVLADLVFGAPQAARPIEGPSGKRIGLVVTREGIFRDNGIDFSERDQRELWRGVIRLLERKGYDYQLFTTGHFSDEVFLDALFRDGGIPRRRVTIAVNSPEELIKELGACDGVIAYRLHASITAFAYAIPSVGLSWNFKVPYFYDSVGYGRRALPPEEWKAETVVAAIERAMGAGVEKDTAFLMTVYDTIFAGLKGIFAPESDARPYSYAELKTRMPPYAGTSDEQYKQKVTGKLRRAYDNYQALATASAEAWSARALARRIRAGFRRITGRGER